MFVKSERKLCSEKSKIAIGQCLICTPRGMPGAYSRDIENDKRLWWQICWLMGVVKGTNPWVLQTCWSFSFNVKQGCTLLIHIQCACISVELECLYCCLWPIVGLEVSLSLENTVWSTYSAVEDVLSMGKRSHSIRSLTERIWFDSNCRILDSCRDAQTAPAPIEHIDLAIRPKWCRCKRGGNVLLLDV